MLAVSASTQNVKVGIDQTIGFDSAVIGVANVGYMGVPNADHIATHLLEQLIEAGVEDRSVTSRWSTRSTVAFVVVTCSIFWGLVVLAVSSFR